MQEFKDGGGGSEEALFFTPAIGWFVKWLFFLYSFRTVSISEFQKALDSRIKTVFFKGCVWKEMLLALGLYSLDESL